MDMSSMMITLPTLYLARQIDFDVGDRLLYMRIAAGALQVVIVGVLFYIRTLITAAADQTEIRVELTKLEKMQDPDSDADYKEQTVEEYDLTKWKALLQQTVMGVLISAFIHYKFEVTVVLVTGFVLGPMRLYKDKLVQYYLLGMRGEEFKRPFAPPPSPFQNIKDQWNEVQNQGKPKKKKVLKKPPNAKGGNNKKKQ